MMLVRGKDTIAGSRVVVGTLSLDALTLRAIRQLTVVVAIDSVRKMAVVSTVDAV
jgi:hypothetical protein